MKQNFFAEFIFIVVLILFSVYRYFYNVESVVMKVFSPTMAAVDLNGNRQIESGEIVCVSGIKTFNNNLADEELAKTLDVSYKDALSLAYITGDFSNSLLMNKSVKFKPDAEQHNPDCTGGDILINNKSYRETLLNEGYAYSDEFEYNSAKLKERIESVKELQPVIMNRKSKKYHEIGCKFGKASEDYAVLLKNDLPENAVPCKWCHKPQENPQAQAGAKVYPDRISDGSVRMFLTDMTTHLNVKNDCSSNICRALLGEINNAKETIDIAAYGWVSVPEVDEALKNAVARGVKFRMVYDFSAREAYYPDTTKIARFAVEAKNDLIPGNSRMSEYLMHNKFMIFDGKKVAAGSLNYSKTDFSEFNSNFILFVDSPEVARVYTEEFEQMLSGKFHTDKTKRAQYSNYKIGDTDLQVYFSPQDNTITEKVIGYIDGAKKYIYLPVFVITHKSLEAALLRAKERGVDVRLIGGRNKCWRQKIFCPKSSLTRDSGES